MLAFLLRLDLSRLAILVEWGLEGMIVLHWLLMGLFYLSICWEFAALMMSSRLAMWAVVRRREFVFRSLDFLGEEGLDDQRYEAFDGIEEFSVRQLWLFIAGGRIESRGPG